MDIWFARMFMLLGALYLIVLWRNLLLKLSKKGDMHSFLSWQFAAATVKGIFIIPLTLFILAYFLWGVGSFLVGLF